MTTGALAWGIMNTMDTMDITGMEVEGSLGLVGEMVGVEDLVEATEEAAEGLEVVVMVAVAVEVAAN